MKKKKLTYNELSNKIDLFINRMMEIERAINYTHSLVISYIDSNDHSDKFVKFLKEQKEKNEQTDGSNTEGNREDKSGNSTPDTKSS